MIELSVIELCAGAGGQSLGLHLAGFRHRLALELDSTAARTLDINLSRLAHLEGKPSPIVAVGDVADESIWAPEAYRGVSLLAAGVPCPPFSIAGRQLGASDERDLFAWAVEIVGRVRPNAVLLENVRGLSMPRFSAYRQAVIERLDHLGYVVHWELLEARDFGVPQLRPRFVLVALRPEFDPYFRWPDPKPTTDTVGTALFGLMAANGWRGASQWAEAANGIAPTIVGGSKKHGGADLGPTRAKMAWASLGVDGLGIADAAPGRSTPTRFRPRLTTEMVARLQGWSGAQYEWDFEGRKTSRYRQIGNAFPPPVARAVGESIAAALRMEGEPRQGPSSQGLHDEIYRALRHSNGFVTLPTLQKMLLGRLTANQIIDHIDHIRRDFHVETKYVRGTMAIKLGAWQAFVGQLDHERHLAYAERGSRSRIS